MHFRSTGPATIVIAQITSDRTMTQGGTIVHKKVLGALAATTSETTTMKSVRAKLLGVLAAASLAGLLLPATPASAAPSSVLDTLAYGQIKAYATGIDQCVTVSQNGSSGNHPTLYSCNQFDDQMWYFPKPGTVGPIINKYSLLYLTAQGSTPGSPAFMYYNSGFPDQQWSAEPIPDAGNVVRFRNYNSNLCLVIQRNSGAQAMQYDCMNYADQKWVIW